MELLGAITLRHAEGLVFDHGVGVLHWSGSLLLKGAISGKEAKDLEAWRMGFRVLHSLMAGFG